MFLSLPALRGCRVRGKPRFMWLTADPEVDVPCLAVARFYRLDVCDEMRSPILLLLSMLFGGYGTTLLTMLLSPYLHGPVFLEGVGSSCGSEVHVKEFDVPLVDAEGLVEFRSLWYFGIPVSLQPSV